MRSRGLPLDDGDVEGVAVRELDCVIVDVGDRVLETVGSTVGLCDAVIVDVNVPEGERVREPLALALAVLDAVADGDAVSVGDPLVLADDDGVALSETRVALAEGVDNAVADWVAVLLLDIDVDADMEPVGLNECNCVLDALALALDVTLMVREMVALRDDDGDCDGDGNTGERAIPLYSAAYEPAPGGDTTGESESHAMAGVAKA